MPILGGIGNISEYAYRGNASFDPCPYDFVNLINQEPNSTYYSLGRILPEDITAPTIIQLPTDATLTYGQSVAVGNGKIVIGDSRFSGLVGRVYVYDLDGTNEIIIESPLNPDTALFGRSVAIGNNAIVVGASGASGGGFVYVFDLNGNFSF